MAKQKQHRPLAPFTRVEIEGHAGVRDDDGEVSTMELHGQVGRVCAANAEYTHAQTGDRMVGMHLGEHGEGGLVAVPRDALKVTTGRPSSGVVSQAFRRGWQAIFGRGVS